MKKIAEIKKPRLEAINITSNIWFYENKKSLHFYVRGYDEAVDFIVPLKKFAHDISYKLTNHRTRPTV